MKEITKWKIWKKYSKYEWTFLILGIFALFIAIISLFTSLGDKTPDPKFSTSVGIENIQDPQFESTLEGIVNNTFHESGEIKILENGDGFLSDLVREIENASSSINITNYIWDDGEFGSTIFEALIKKAKAGVEVRVLLDGLSGEEAEEKYRKKFEKAGGKIGVFRDLSLARITRLHRRTHVRAIVIDGKIGYTGGIAISDLWLGNATSTTSWHDFMFKTQGNMSQETQKVFAYMWAQTTGEILSGEKMYPTRNEEKNNSVSGSSSGYGKAISFFSSPSPDLNSSMEHFLWVSLSAAQKSIHIENPYLLLSKPLIEILKKKAESGIEVVIIIPGKHTDQKTVQWASKSYYKDLLESGVQIYEYEPSRIHAKFMTVDGAWSIIGSANMDNRSRELNLEAIFGINDSQFGKTLDDVFAKDKERSKQVDAGKWKRNSKIIQPFRILSRFFVKQY